MKKTIALDVDGVLLCFYQKMCERFDMKMETLTSWSLDWINDNFSKIADDGDFWRTLPPLINPKDIPFEFDYYVTALPEHQKNNRMVNLWMLGFPYKPIIVCNEKHKTCKKLGIDVLVDDKPSTIDECRKNGINAIYYQPHYVDKSFRADLNPCRTFDEVKKQLNNTYEQ